ncbi:hypothetical protein ACFLS9_02555 [Bacteroidota bacterium]
MKIEFEIRKRNGLISKFSNLESLDYNKLLDLAETASFDLVCLLPAEILVDENNLPEIVCKAIKSLSGIYQKEEFNIYTVKRAKLLIKQIVDIFKKSSSEEIYQRN